MDLDLDLDLNQLNLFPDMPGASIAVWVVVSMIFLFLARNTGPQYDPGTFRRNRGRFAQVCRVDEKGGQRAA